MGLKKCFSKLTYQTKVVRGLLGERHYSYLSVCTVLSVWLFAYLVFFFPCLSKIYLSLLYSFFIIIIICLMYFLHRKYSVTFSPYQRVLVIYCNCIELLKTQMCYILYINCACTFYFCNLCILNLYLKNPHATTSTSLLSYKF